MITKRSYCKLLIENYLREQEEDRFKDEDLVLLNLNDKTTYFPNLLSSSSLCVAMEYLGLLDDEDTISEKLYANTRAGSTGIMYQNIKSDGEIIPEILSVRDLLSILPDNIEE